MVGRCAWDTEDTGQSRNNGPGYIKVDDEKSAHVQAWASKIGRDISNIKQNNGILGLRLK